MQQREESVELHLRGLNSQLSLIAKTHLFNRGFSLFFKPS